MTAADVRQAARIARNEGSRPGSARLVLTAALLGFFMISLDATAVNVALPAIGRSLHGATSGLQWVVDGYTVPFAALLISAGAVSDRLGARRVFGWGLVVFAAASAGCGLAPVLPVLIAARLVQGCAAAVMLPSSLALVRQAFADPAARARAVAVWSSGGAAAIAAGPVLGGILTSAAGWRAIFFVNLPVGAAVLALLVLRAPRSPRLAAPLDPPGQVTAVLGLAALTFGVIAGGADGFTTPSALTALVAAALACVCFFTVESRIARPMVPLALFRSPAVVTCVVTGFSINAAFYGVAFVLSLYFQRVLGESAITAGLLFLPMTGLLTVANLGSARVAARWGHHVPVRAGLCVGTLGMLLLAFLRGRIGMEIALVPVGTGLGFALPSLTFLLLDSLPAAQAGLAGGLFNAGRQTGGALAVATFGTLVSGSFMTGMRVSMLISGVLLFVSTVAAFAVFRRRVPVR
ncbi:MAG: transporter, family, methylenomycin resistance protein [Streptosporangiaceae bacterium]|nr:transporter, family, methylenomycin resistance protein [Streptosporangiaceae bacterium]